MANRTELDADREDFFAVWRMRFGDVPEPVDKHIRSLEDAGLLGRLILVAANAATKESLLKELNAAGPAFRIVGEQFDPLAKEEAGRET